MRNNQFIKTIDTLNAGDVIEINLPDEENNITPIDGILSILYEDEYIIAVDKPVNMPVHPTKTHQLDTLANIVSYYQHQNGENYVFRALNRLDKDTTGIVIIAKDKYIATALNDIDKTYLAVCEGIADESGVIEKPIRIKKGHSIQRETGDGGHYALTCYRRISYFNDLSFLEVKIETGLTHQIRCHMADIGHPLAGDDMYGGSLLRINRQALHCAKAGFTHPISKKRILIESPLPDDINSILSE